MHRRLAFWPAGAHKTKRHQIYGTGYGYVEFNSKESLDSAISSGSYELDVRQLTVDKAGNKT